jgi:hypothetical protein
MPMAFVPLLAVPVVAALAAQAGPDLGFEVPAGYVQQRQGAMVILAPTNAEQQPCIYGLAGRYAAAGSLDASAEQAVHQVVVPGWRRLDDRHAAMRGVSADGWPYAWYRAAFAGEIGGQRQAVNAMAMVLPAGAGQVHVVWGMGNIARCLTDDAAFEQLFHSLRPGGWTSDGGRALTQQMLGGWRFSASAGVQQLTFAAGGRYARDLGSRARAGVTERTSTTATDGRFAVRDGELLLVPDHRPASPDRYRVRVYDEWFLGGWKRAMTLVDAGGGRPNVVQYYRIEPWALGAGRAVRASAMIADASPAGTRDRSPRCRRRSA